MSVHEVCGFNYVKCPIPGNINYTKEHNETGDSLAIKLLYMLFLQLGFS